MKLPNWNDLLPTHEHIQAMTPEQLGRAEDACHQYSGNLFLGISAIGNLLACTASNGETGLNDDAVAKLGWMLENLGDLGMSLIDTGSGVNYRLQAIKQKG